MGQKNVKVCRNLQQLGNEKAANTTVCREFHGFLIPALGIEGIPETLVMCRNARASGIFAI